MFTTQKLSEQQLLLMAQIIGNLDRTAKSLEEVLPFDDYSAQAGLGHLYQAIEQFQSFQLTQAKG